MEERDGGNVSIRCNSRLIVAVVCVTLGLSACGRDGESKVSENSRAATPLGKACDGVFDEESVAEISGDLGSGGVYEPSNDASYPGSPAEVGKILNKGMKDSRAVSICQFSKKDRGGIVLDISAEWSPDAFATKKLDVEPSMTTDSVVFELKAARYPNSNLYVACERPDLVEAGTNMLPLKFVISGNVSLSARVRAKSLQAAAAKTLFSLQCRNKVVFIDPPKGQPRLK